MKKKSQFSTVITFESGDSHTEDTPKEKLGSTIQRLLNGPAAIAGLIKEFKIIANADDTIILHVINGLVVFPN